MELCGKRRATIKNRLLGIEPTSATIGGNIYSAFPYPMQVTVKENN
jgi:hypothetical protein